ncbi:MAG: hypothetical protein R3C53_12125 [Pirellulaceae bacterium]
MKQFAKSYISALLVVLLAMAAYQLIVVPAIEPSVIRSVARPIYEPVLGDERWWQGLFPQGQWQVDNPTIVQNSRGVLLANSWEQVGPKSWKLQPLTMILPQSDHGKPSSIPLVHGQGFEEQDVWIVNAEEGALIHFEEPFDLRASQAPSIERGQLSGAITITRRSVKPTNEKPWSLATSDLSIDRRRISTSGAVEIRWADSIVRGRDLRVMLRRDVLGGGGSDASSPWGPLDELELYHVDEIDVGLPAGGLWAGVSPSMLAVNMPVQNLPARLSAQCGGRFAFDFKNSTASFLGGVQLRHQLGQLPPDEFFSHRVSVTVEPPSKDDRTPASGKATLGGIQIKEVVALGIDSLQDFFGEQWVDLKSPTLGAEARAKKLRINLDQQRVELAGKLDQPGATQSVAWLDYQGYEFRAPAIEYQAAPADPQGKALHPGWMFASGPGEMLTSAASENGQSQIRWQQSLKMAPAELPGEQWLELAGNTLVENQRQGFMTAERLQIWLKKNTNTSASSSDSQHSDLKNARYLPDRVLATGDTTLAAADIKAHVGTLHLQMVYAPAKNDLTQITEPKGIPLSDSMGNPMYRFASPPPRAADAGQVGQGAGQAAIVPTIGTHHHVSPPRHSTPATIYGSSLNTTIVSAGEESWVDALTIDGPLQIESGEPMEADALPWAIAGQQLVLATNPAGQVDMQITGSPARIIVADGALEGPVIRFDQINNLIWMDQPGNSRCRRVCWVVVVVRDKCQICSGSSRLTASGLAD